MPVTGNDQQQNVTAPFRFVDIVTEPQDIELTVVLPCLDEAETLETCVRKARSCMDELGVRGEVVVADNGSTDGSQAIAEAAGARVVPVARRGYGAAIRGGIDAARGRYVLMADADDSYALDDLGPFLSELRAGAQLVMGNRFQGGIAPGAMPPLHRYLGNPVLSWAGRRFFRVPIGDFHCGIRAFHRDSIRALGMQTDGMEFASETVVRSALAGLRITEVPTTLRPDGRSRPPHLRTWSDGWRHLRFLLAFSPRWLFLYPAVVALTVGLAGLAALSLGTVTIGAVSFGIHTMLACATLVILGLQVGGLALVSRAYAARLALLPPSPRLEKWIERVTLERGLVLGLTSVLLGVGAFVTALLRWGAQGFGELDPVATMRLPIVGMVLVVGGTQVAAAAFAVSLTGLGRHPDATTESGAIEPAGAEASGGTARRAP
ncbi:glycosyltransferase family 2 protein [Blastococcus saxobsidens]|uniref:Glycosyl transferase n=1 Tax=Blastococcus saxobsidens (strain DD2) TaxID=1146883 RepID=H6RL03_BLASD|nr:glycosyltransferase family 2 protein [Blastococcus saxobsidens]CCG04970.1 Glycosyl transferase [Blastococcus saxobsidens DD2]